MKNEYPTTGGEHSAAAQTEIGVRRTGSHMCILLSVVVLGAFLYPISNLASPASQRRIAAEQPIEDKRADPPLPLPAATAAPPQRERVSVVAPSPPASSSAAPAEGSGSGMSSSPAAIPSVPVESDVHSPVCENVRSAVRQYKRELAGGQPATVAAQPSRGPLRIVWRILRHDKSGLGSNLKGLISTFALAMAFNASFSVESDCPELADYFTSDVIDIRSAVGAKRLPSARTHCGDWVKPMKAGQFSGLPEDRFTPNDAAENSGQELQVLCDRHLLHHFPKNPILRDLFHKRFRIPIYDGPHDGLLQHNQQNRSQGSSGGGSGTDGPMPKGTTGSSLLPMSTGGGTSIAAHPAIVFGCLFDAVLSFKPEVKQKVSAVLRDAKRPILGIQIRRGGRGVTWKDPGRVNKRQERPFVACIASMLKERIGRQSPLDVFITTDSRGMYDSLASAPFLKGTGRVVAPYLPGVYVHTALSSPSESQSGDVKVVVDLATLMAVDEAWITRSAFGEVPAWVAASRRPETFRMALLMRACGMPDQDCSVEDC